MTLNVPSAASAEWVLLLFTEIANAEENLEGVDLDCVGCALM